MNSNIFIKNGNFCVIEKDEYEPFEHYYERCNFIVSQINNGHYTDDITYSQYVIYSKIWLNIKYLGCEYDKDIHDIIDVMTKKLSTRI